MTTDQLKRNAARAAIDYVRDDTIVGVGTGSTVNHFIEALAQIKHRIDGTVSSSEATTQRLRALNIRVFDLNVVDAVYLYVDGADEADHELRLVKGGGGALTREKILACAADTFVCIADESKLVKQLGTFPLPVEVLPMARSYVARQLVKLGGDPVYRKDFLTDNGNRILDVHHLVLDDPLETEREINDIAGVVSNGLFTLRPADVLLVGRPSGVEKIESGSKRLKRPA